MLPPISKTILYFAILTALKTQTYLGKLLVYSLVARVIFLGESISHFMQRNGVKFKESWQVIDDCDNKTTSHKGKRGAFLDRSQWIYNRYKSFNSNHQGCESWSYATNMCHCKSKMIRNPHYQLNCVLDRPIWTIAINES